MSQIFHSDILIDSAMDDKRYCIDVATVAIQDGMTSGSALELVGGKYVWVEAANVGNTSAVLLDERADQDTPLTAGDYELKVISRAAIVGQLYLTFADALDDTQLASAHAALLSNTIKVSEQV